MLDLKLVSCLTKVFPDEAPAPLRYAPEGLRGEEAAFQLAWKDEDPSNARSFVRLDIESPVKEYLKAYRVRSVPGAGALLKPEDRGEEQLSLID